MSDLLMGLLGALLATNQTAAVSNLVVQKTGVSLTLPATNDPVERAYRKLMEDDDAAQEEIDRWIQEARKEEAAGNSLSAITLKGRIKQRLAGVQKAYEAFLQSHPNHSGARLAFGSFLNDIQEEEEAREQWEKACQLDPKNAAAWNNLANYHGHHGGAGKAIEYYLKAIELEPHQSLYYENLATTVYLFRREATNHFKITEAAAIQKSLQLYRKSLDLDPGNFLLATHYAETYYGIKPPKTADSEADRQAAEQLNREALQAWQRAHALARDDIERQGVEVHFARLNINGGRVEEARKNLAGITNGMFNSIKATLTRKLEGLGSGTSREPGNAAPARASGLVPP